MQQKCILRLLKLSIIILLVRRSLNINNIISLYKQNYKRFCCQLFQGFSRRHYGVVVESLGIIVEVLGSNPSLTFFLFALFFQNA